MCGSFVALGDLSSSQDFAVAGLHQALGRGLGVREGELGRGGEGGSEGRGGRGVRGGGVGLGGGGGWGEGSEGMLTAVGTFVTFWLLVLEHFRSTESEKTFCGWKRECGCTCWSGTTSANGWWSQFPTEL